MAAESDLQTIAQELFNWTFVKSSRLWCVFFAGAEEAISPPLMTTYLHGCCKDRGNCPDVIINLIIRS